MVPQNKQSSDSEITEQLPAQEKAISTNEPSPQFSAEQVYAQRFAEKSVNGKVETQGFVP